MVRMAFAPFGYEGTKPVVASIDHIIRYLASLNLEVVSFLITSLRAYTWSLDDSATTEGEKANHIDELSSDSMMAGFSLFLSTANGAKPSRRCPPPIGAAEGLDSKAGLLNLVMIPQFSHASTCV
jgi:hypothetical protein